MPTIDPIASAHYRRAELLAGDGRFEEAIVEYDRAIQVGEAFADAYRGLGFAHARLGKNDAARTALNRDLALDPANWQSHGGLGNLLAAEGDFDPDFPDGFANMVH